MTTTVMKLDIPQTKSLEEKDLRVTLTELKGINLLENDLFPTRGKPINISRFIKDET
jgi:hypothetical protein